MDWDLTSYFAELMARPMRNSKMNCKEILRRHVSSRRHSTVAEDNADAWEAIFLLTEGLTDRLSHLGSYLGCLTAADARNEDYAREEAAFALLAAESEKLDVELLRALKDVSDEFFAKFAHGPPWPTAATSSAANAKTRSRTMIPEKEMLSADLGVDGLHAWGRLYDSISGKLEFDMTFPDGRTERRPISQRRALMEDPDRRVRQAAFDGGNRALGKHGRRHGCRAQRHFGDAADPQTSIAAWTTFSMSPSSRRRFRPRPRRNVRSYRRANRNWPDASSPPRHSSWALRASLGTIWARRYRCPTKGIFLGKRARTSSPAPLQRPTHA